LAQPLATFDFLLLTRWPAFAVAGVVALGSSNAWAQPTAPENEAHENLLLPPPAAPSLQYGAAFTAEVPWHMGSICPKATSTPCILGAGAGLIARVGVKIRDGWYFGGAYSFTKQDASNLLRLPILQSLRAETRRYFYQDFRGSPYISMGLGFVLYGSEWSAETYGGIASIGVGVEYQLTRSVVLGLQPAYRIIPLRPWTDDNGLARGAGPAHFFGLELTLEVLSPLARW
jgi:hypothetical protein